MVKKGDLLAVIGSERLREEGGGERAAVRQSVDAEKATIEREIDAARQEAAMNRLMLDKRLHGLREERETLRADLRSGERLLASLTAQSDHVASAAAEGYLPRQQAAQKRDEVSAQESRLASVRGAAGARRARHRDQRGRAPPGRRAPGRRDREPAALRAASSNRLRCRARSDAEQVDPRAAGRPGLVRVAGRGPVGRGRPAAVHDRAAGRPARRQAAGRAGRGRLGAARGRHSSSPFAPIRRSASVSSRRKVDSVNEIPSLPGEVPQGSAGVQRADVRRHRVAARRAPLAARRGAAAQARHARRRAGADRAPDGARVAARPDPARPQRQRRPRRRRRAEARR